MMNQLILCDTNVLIDSFNGRTAAVEALDRIGQPNALLSVISSIEIYRGARNKEHLAQLRRRLRKLRVVGLTEEIGGTALDLIDEYHLSYGLDIPDALIAATAVAYDLPLFTYNRRDFHFIAGLRLHEVSAL